MKAPVVNELSDGTNTNTEQKANFEQLNGFVRQLLGGAPFANFKLDAGGAVKPISSPCTIEAFTGTTDDLANITIESGATTTGYPDGSVIVISPRSAHTITVKHAAGGSGQISLVGAADFVMSLTSQWLWLNLRGTTWFEIGRFYGGDKAAARAFYGLTSAATIPNPVNPDDDGKAILASSGGYVLGTPTVAIGPAHRVQVSRTSDVNPGLANGSTYSQVQFNSVEIDTDSGNLWDESTHEILIPSGVTYARFAANLAMGFSSAPSGYWWQEMYLFRKPSGGSYPATPDGHSTAGLLWDSFQGNATAGNQCDLNAQSGFIPVAAGDRFKLMVRGYNSAGGNLTVKGATLPAFCWLEGQLFA